MMEITVNEAKDRLMSARPGLYASFAGWAYDSAYKSEKHSAVIIRAPRGYGSNPFVWYICDTGNTDMDLAHTEVKENNDDELDVIMIYARELQGTYCLNFSCIGKPYDDPDIRFISEDDRGQVFSITNVSDDDNPFAESIAQNLLQNYIDMIQNSDRHMLGIFDGETLAGAVAIEKPNNQKAVRIIDIFIPHESRGRGYAPRLIRAGLALYPGLRFTYDCGSDNYPSVAAAKSAGFVFEGTWVF